MAKEQSLKKSNLDINLWLINWGVLSGEYKDEVFTITKFARFNNWFSFSRFVLAIIKPTILMFYEKQSKIAIYLGKWSY